MRKAGLVSRGQRGGLDNGKVWESRVALGEGAGAFLTGCDGVPDEG